MVWLFSIYASWTTHLETNPIWNNLSFLHHFAIVMSILNLLIKIGLIVSLMIYSKQEQNKKDVSIS